MLGAPVEIVPKHMGTTCFSLAFTLASALFGTFTPLASNWLINGPMTRLTRFWLMFAAVLGIIAALTVYPGPSSHRELRSRRCLSGPTAF